MAKSKFGEVCGFGLDRRPEVAEAKDALRSIGIDLDSFKHVILRVTIRPRPIGFDFTCEEAERLLELAKDTCQLGLDGGTSPEAGAGAPASSGKRFRQIGYGKRLHLVIDPNGTCNVHLDTRGFVTGRDGSMGRYDFNELLKQGADDLESELPDALGATGLAEMVKPAGDLDESGKACFSFGVHVEW